MYVLRTRHGGETRRSREAGKEGDNHGVSNTLIEEEKTKFSALGTY